MSGGAVQKVGFITQSFKTIEDIFVLVLRPSIYDAMQEEVFDSEDEEINSPLNNKYVSEAEVDVMLDELGAKKSIWNLPVFKQIKTVYNFVFKPDEYEKDYIVSRLQLAGKPKECYISYLIAKKQQEKSSLGVITEEDYDALLKKVIENQQDQKHPEEKEFIHLIKQNEHTPELIDEIVKGVENQRYKLDVADKAGDTLLHVAVQKKGLERLVVALLNNGEADLPLKWNKKEQTPIDLAYSQEMKTAIKVFSKQMKENADSAKRLLQQLVDDGSVSFSSTKSLSVKYKVPVLRVQDVLPTENGNKSPQPITRYRTKTIHYSNNCHINQRS